MNLQKVFSVLKTRAYFCFYVCTATQTAQTSEVRQSLQQTYCTASLRPCYLAEFFPSDKTIVKNLKHQNVCAHKYTNLRQLLCPSVRPSTQHSPVHHSSKVERQRNVVYNWDLVMGFAGSSHVYIRLPHHQKHACQVNFRSLPLSKAQTKYQPPKVPLASNCFKFFQRFSVFLYYCKLSLSVFGHSSA